MFLDQNNVEIQVFRVHKLGPDFPITIASLENILGKQ
jgi:hypothetical protein